MSFTRGAAQTMSRLELVIGELQAARQYLLRLIESVPTRDWFRIPQGGVSHVAWQVGHLAMAQYRLCLERIRGERPSDLVELHTDLYALFRKGSSPQDDPAAYPPAEMILDMLNLVDAQAHGELPWLSETDLDSPPLSPHPLFTTKYGGLCWCVRHEMLHAGQIGMIRRQLGAAPIW